MHSETIVAIATPPGKGAISVVRVSGPQAREIVSRYFRAAREGDLRPRQTILGQFVNSHEQRLDRVLVTFFSKPGSYTGEDLVEISSHGSPIVAREIVETLLGAGARLAQPGEFTMRAFLNGKIDLAQAEAVRDLINSQTAFQARIAGEQLEGKLSHALKPVKEELVRILCHMETALEFVDDDLQPETRLRLIQSLEQIDGRLKPLEESFRLGKIVHDGLTVAITGKPNSGKSSLFNALLQEERAIVTAIPGTTRDALTETINLRGIPARLADTAGIRQATDLVEHLGVQKSLEYLKASDVVLFLVDGSECFGEEDAQVWQWVREKPYILVLNKCDLPPRAVVPEEIRCSCAAALQISALHHTHLEELKSALLQVVNPEGGFESEKVMVTNIRHKRCIELSRRHLHAGIESYRAGLSEEFPVYDFRKSLDALAEITGETTVEDILNQIFSTFCIGK